MGYNVNESENSKNKDIENCINLSLSEFIDFISKNDDDCYYSECDQEVYVVTNMLYDFSTKVTFSYDKYYYKCTNLYDTFKRISSRYNNDEKNELLSKLTLLLREEKIKKILNGTTRNRINIV